MPDPSCPPQHMPLEGERPLPPEPLLEGAWLERVTLPAPELGQLEAWVPAAARYRCESPDAPAFVGVPGFAMDAKSMLRQLPLGKLADIHLLQLPGGDVAGEEGLGHFARYVETYIAASALERRPGGVVLLGTSMGGAVALLVALRGRVALRGLVLVGTFGSARHLRWYHRALCRYWWIAPAWLVRLCARPLLKWTRFFGSFSPEEARFILSCLHIPSRQYLRNAAAGLRTLEQIQAAKGLAVPTLVIHGAADRVLRPAAGRELAEAIPGARAAMLPSAGHALFFLDHDLVNAAVAAFLDGLPAMTNRV